MCRSVLIYSYVIYLSVLSILFISIFVKKDTNKIVPIMKNALIPYLVGELMVDIAGASPLIRILGEIKYGFLYLNYSYLVLLIVVCFIFKIRLNKFSWKITYKQFIYVLILCGLWVIPQIVLFGGNHLAYNIYRYDSIHSYLIDIILQIPHPAIYEELVYRGLLISTLKAYIKNESIINIIQAFIFGVVHYTNYTSQLSIWMACLATGGQILTGFILGKLYFKTKSLTPCIILHLLRDTI
ncbi:CPBP family intramembrane glutamic endopeptidase [Clostridium oryzae]|uniref:CAAX amino terminal protease self-immunity n=1 Tax=Clostridium oryzae TaxID=1450648 RepID=A0A1V4IN23_9CLOT|nr:CPBP family intramembrane glutamic endopeptidase [Clostridium oryzae]OPJ61441.1 CAAX amino terminal protease self- immunity [Clostridium oryzae]